MYRRRNSVVLSASLLLVALLVAGPASAAKPSVTGSIDLATEAGVNSADAGMSYGDLASFDATVDGKVSSKASTYITVVCAQGETIVYQWSGALDFSYPLVDQAGQGLEWDGEAAECSAHLVYKVENGKNTTITYLDAVLFSVAGA